MQKTARKLRFFVYFARSLAAPGPEFHYFYPFGVFLLENLYKIDKKAIPKFDFL